MHLYISYHYLEIIIAVTQSIYFFSEKENMLAMLSLLKKMTTFIITGVNTLYFKSNYNMKKVWKSSHGNHWKNLIKIFKITIKLLQHFWLTKDSILNVVNINLSIHCTFIYIHFINFSVYASLQHFSINSKQITF